MKNGEIILRIERIEARLASLENDIDELPSYHIDDMTVGNIMAGIREILDGIESLELRDDEAVLDRLDRMRDWFDARMNQHESLLKKRD